MGAEELLADRAIVVADTAGVIRVWSDAAAEMFAMPAEQAVGQRLDLMIPAHLREVHWKAFEHAVSARVTKYEGLAFADPVLHGDGSVAIHRGWIDLLRDTAGTVVGVISMWEPARAEDQELPAPRVVGKRG